jgi:hypothetical protein
MAALAGNAAFGQTDAQEGGQAGNAAPRRAVETVKQTDIGVSGYFAMNGNTAGNGTQQTTTNAPGGLAELRQIQSNWIGYEIGVSFNPANQAYAPTASACSYVCANPPTKITGNAVETSLAYVVSKKMGNLRPFALGGIGAFIVIPGATPFGNNTSIRATYVFGGGVDYNIGNRLGLRIQVRDNMYKAPNDSSIYPATGVFTQSLEPMGGVYYRF